MQVWLVGLLAVVMLGRVGFGAMDTGEAFDAIEGAQRGTKVMTAEEEKEAVGVAIEAVLSKKTPAGVEERLGAWEKEFPRAMERTGKKGDGISDVGKVLAAWGFHQEMMLPVEEVKAAADAEKFPGAVASDAARVTKTLVIDRHGGGWKSTGLYAAPGEIVTVTIPAAAVKQGWSVRIGCHTDRLWKLEKWPRFPEISRSFPLAAEKTEVVNGYGGLIYVVAPIAAGEGKIAVVVAGAVESPWFVLGETTSAEWKLRIRDLPGPWAELQSGKMILSVPSRVVRGLDDPAALLEFWDKVLDADADLAGIPHERARQQRMTTDVEISAGYMHSGYPVMTHLDAAPRMVDLQTLSTKGDWGFFHELGHNHQQSDWTFPGTVEVTVNLFTVYVMENVCTAAGVRKGLSEPEMLATMKKYVAAGSDFEKWKGDPFLALCMYLQMKDAFGWEPYKKVFAEYRDLKNGERPKTELEKHDQWMVRMSRAVGRDLGPFFEKWGVPVSEGARAQIKDLPEWMPEGWEGK